jgi:GntR family transcriptional repressor for pyruvate dehydrogenase complex
MSSTKPEKVTNAARVAKHIQRFVIDANLQPGDRLPSQSELAEKLDSGTRSVREAIKILEARGILETHHGKGVFLKEGGLDFFLEMLNDSFSFNLYRDSKILSQLTSVRRMIQSSVVYDIAEHPNPETLKDLVGILHEMDECVPGQDIDRYNKLDAKFHFTLIERCGNDILITLYRNLSSLLIRSIEKTGYMVGSLDQSLVDHRKIVEALIARDPERSRDTMYRHLTRTQERLKELEE